MSIPILGSDISSAYWVSWAEKYYVASHIVETGVDLEVASNVVIIDAGGQCMVPRGDPEADMQFPFMGTAVG